MAAFETIFTSDGITYVRRISDGLTVPHDSPLAAEVVNAPDTGLTVDALAKALVSKGALAQADVDAATVEVAEPVTIDPTPVVVS